MADQQHRIGREHFCVPLACVLAAAWIACSCGGSSNPLSPQSLCSQNCDKYEICGYLEPTDCYDECVADMNDDRDTDPECYDRTVELLTCENALGCDEFSDFLAHAGDDIDYPCRHEYSTWYFTCFY